MKRFMVIVLFCALTIFTVRCSEKDINTSEPGSRTTMRADGSQPSRDFGGGDRANYGAVLSGDTQVPEPARTSAKGLTGFRFNKDYSKIYYKIEISKLENILSACIHLGPANQSGPVIVWLYPSNQSEKLISGEFSGLLKEGTISPANLTGPLKGKSLAELKTAIDAGSTYVNIRTSQYPKGEIRGQITHVKGKEKETAAEYRVILENLTPATGEGTSQPFSPPVLVTHTSLFHIFRPGHKASPELKKVVEDAINEPLVEYLENSTNAHDIVNATRVIDPQKSDTFTISSDISYKKMSLVSMLVNTNDTFTGADAVRLPGRGSVVYYLKAYDAGTEKNTELKADIPGPCCGNTITGTYTSERIRFSEGISGSGDLDPAVYNWKEPVARLTITRIR